MLLLWMKLEIGIHSNPFLLTSPNPPWLPASFQLLAVISYSLTNVDKTFGECVHKISPANLLGRPCENLFFRWVTYWLSILHEAGGLPQAGSRQRSNPSSGTVLG